MKVVVHPADQGGCGHYRLIWPAEALAAQGHDVTIEHDRSYRAVWQPMAIGTDRIVGLDETLDADVVVLQRPLDRSRVEMIGAIQAQGVAVVVEIDDDFHAIHRRNPAWATTNPLRDPDKNRDWLKKACERADLVTVSTPALAKRYGAHERVVVIPNYVPEKYTTLNGGAYTDEFLATGSHEYTRVGWSGSVATHPDDLEATQGAIRRVLDRGGAEFHVVGTGVGVQDALKLAVPPHATGWLPIFAYPEGLQSFDVGIAPLARHAFNNAKSCLKGLEMAAVGVPFIASPTDDYRRLAADGIGWLAETPAEWESLVGELVHDPTHRATLATAWRAQVAERYTIEMNAHRWWAAWEYAVELARGRVAA